MDRFASIGFHAYCPPRLIMWKLAALASLALCAAQTPAAPDATTGKAAPNVTVTEARPAPQPKRAHE